MWRLLRDQLYTDVIIHSWSRSGTVSTRTWRWRTVLSSSWRVSSTTFKLAMVAEVPDDKHRRATRTVYRWVGTLLRWQKNTWLRIPLPYIRFRSSFSFESWCSYFCFLAYSLVRTLKRSFSGPVFLNNYLGVHPTLYMFPRWIESERNWLFPSCS